MPIDILNAARTYLVSFLKEKQNGFETKHPWRKDWEFAVLHSLRVESYTLKILAREHHLLSEPEIILLRLAAILHDIARLKKHQDALESSLNGQSAIKGVLSAYMGAIMISIDSKYYGKYSKRMNQCQQ